MKKYEIEIVKAMADKLREACGHCSDHCSTTDGNVCETYRLLTAAKAVCLETDKKGRLLPQIPGGG